MAETEREAVNSDWQSEEGEALSVCSLAFSCPLEQAESELSIDAV